MLSALDRYLAVIDRGTYDRALERINESIEDGAVLGATVTRLDGVSEPLGPEPLPDLRTARDRLAIVMRDIVVESEEDR